MAAWQAGKVQVLGKGNIERCESSRDTPHVPSLSPVLSLAAATHTTRHGHCLPVIVMGNIEKKGTNVHVNVKRCVKETEGEEIYTCMHTREEAGKRYGEESREIEKVRGEERRQPLPLKCRVSCSSHCHGLPPPSSHRSSARYPCYVLLEGITTEKCKVREEIRQDRRRKYPKETNPVFVVLPPKREGN